LQRFSGRVHGRFGPGRDVCARGMAPATGAPWPCRLRSPPCRPRDRPGWRISLACSPGTPFAQSGPNTGPSGGTVSG
jgi:hypothetical protein